MLITTTLTPPTLRRALYANAGAASRPGVNWFESSTARPGQAATVVQDEVSYTLSFDVPGVTREQLSVGIDENVVRLTTVEDAPRQYRFAFELPQAIDPTQSAAKLELGVLTLKLAKVVPVNRVAELVIQ
jgi:HSP20 family molecular chaperone IbpA